MVRLWPLRASPGAQDRLRSASGKVSWVTMGLVAGIATAAYLGWHYVPLYLDHYDVKSAMRGASAYAYREPDDARVKEKLLREISQVGGRWVTPPDGERQFLGVIDMETVDVQLQRKANQHIDIWVSYARPVDWLWIKRRTWQRFSTHVEGDLTPVTWGKTVGE